MSDIQQKITRYAKEENTTMMRKIQSKHTQNCYMLRLPDKDIRTVLHVFNRSTGVEDTFPKALK